MRAFAVTLIAALVLSAPTGCVLVASTGEYRLYRKIRLTDSDLIRGRLIRSYETQYGSGALSARVAAERRRLDTRMYRAAVDEYGLRQYLRALPDGERSGEAEARLAQARRVRAARQAAEQEREAQERSLARQEEAQRRRWFRAAFLGWAQILERVGTWNQPLEAFLEANAELAAVWREGDVAPTCEGDVCTREYPHDYFIKRTGGTRIDRQARFLLRVHQTAGLVTRIDVLIAGQGFFAWRELESQEEVDPEDPAQMADARERARVALAEMVKTHLAGGAEAEVPPDAAGRVLWAWVKDLLGVEVVAAPADAEGVGPGEGLSFSYQPPAPPPAPEPPRPRPRRR